VRARRSAEPAPPGEPAAKLIVMAGPAAGEEFALSGDEVVIGRSGENAVSIPDTSVSRKHVLLRKTPEGWAASDMGSGNGTLVNGKAIAEETPLAAGDVITIGDTELKYEDATSAPGARRAPVRRGGAAGAQPVNTTGMTRAVVRTSRRNAGETADLQTQRKKLIIRVSALLIVLVGGGVAFKVVQDKQKAGQLAILQSEAERKKALSARKQEATNLIREGKWKEARVKLIELKEEAPTFEAAQIDTFLAAAEKEIPNQERLLEAADAVSKGEIASAARALEQVTKETTSFKQRERIQADMDKRIAERVKDAQVLLGYPTVLTKMEELKAMVEDILVARPEHRDALAFKQVADDAIRRIKNPPPPKKAPPGKPWLAVQDRFQSGDQTGAYALAEACAAKDAKCKTLKGQIAEFGDKLKKAEGMTSAELAALVELDRRITGGTPSPLSKSFARKAADGLCVKATNARGTGNWALAIENAKKALLIDPGSACATGVIQEGKQKSKDMYLQAYTSGSEDDKIKLYKDVIAMTPKDDEYHRKAQDRLAELAK
jgi:hypothetical protein